KRQFHASEITMPKVNLSGMSVEALMDLRRRVDEMLLEHRAELEKRLERMTAFAGARARRWKRIERKEGSTEIPWSVRRDLGRPWCKTSLACCCDQRWKEARRFLDRQVSTKGTEKAQIEAVILGHQWN